MGKIALLVPREEMLQQAHNILQEIDLELSDMKMIRTEDSVVEARRAIAKGATIIIARGLQAAIIQRYTNVPVIPITVTAQEMALLVKRAKNISKKEIPSIAVIGMKNMFSNIEHFEELFGVHLTMYYSESATVADFEKLTLQAVTDQPDFIIGGDTAVAVASREGVPSLFLTTTEDAMRQALISASRMDFAMTLEKRSAAQMETLQDYSFNGIVWIDKKGTITSVNPMLVQLSGKEEETVIRHKVSDLAPEITDDVLKQVLVDGKEYSLYLEWQYHAVFATIAPVSYDGSIDGAVMTCHKMKKKSERGNNGKKGEESLKGFKPASLYFQDLLQKSPSMQECVRIARLYAYSEQPVVLTGESGTEKRMLAECIHNNSKRADQPFLDVPCEGMTAEEQRISIFGERGAFMQSLGGTVLIRKAEELTEANQYRLYQVIYFHVLHGSEIAQLRKVNVRVMVTLHKPLHTLWQEGKLQNDLYYLLSGLELRVPPLRERKEDLSNKIDLSIRECCDRYLRYHVLTAGAKEILMNYEWPGNLFQVESFIDRLILTAQRRSVDEIMVKKLLYELYPEVTQPVRINRAVLPNVSTGMEDKRQMAGGDEIDSLNAGISYEATAVNHYVGEAQKIANCLNRNQGNREKTAQELGISKATLWRHMKKYGIEGK